MKNKKIMHTAAMLAACMALSGCGFGSSADSLLSPPMLSDEQEAIYRALEQSAGDDITLVYPKSGAYRSAFIFHDLDDDSSEEAVVFYGKNKDAESAVRVNILDFQEGHWRSIYDHAGAGSSVEQVFFTDLGGKGRIHMAVGYSYMTPTEKTLRLYRLEESVLKTEYTESYYKLSAVDLDRDGGEDIAVINCNNENHSAYISLVTDRGNGAECASSVDLNANTADIPSVFSGYIGEGTPALFVDGLMGSGNLSTEIIYCVNGELRNPANLAGSELASLTSRSAGLYCRDIDGDGIVEIPAREAFPGYRDNGEMNYITNWNIFENYTVSKKYSSLTVPEKGYCFMLPVRWEGLVTVKNDSVTGEKVFYKYNNSLSESRLELMRILVCTPSEAGEKSIEGYVTAGSTDSAVYMVKFGNTEDNLLLTLSEVTNNFYLY